jgi:hypothetical protein
MEPLFVGTGTADSGTVFEGSAADELLRGD